MELIHGCEKELNFNIYNDWPEWLEMPTEEDIKTLAELSERNTSSTFFDN